MMETYEKVTETYAAEQYDGTATSIEAIVNMIGEKKVAILNRGLVNAAPQCIVHASHGSVSLQTGDWVAVANSAHTVHVFPHAAFESMFRMTPAPIETTVAVESIGAGTGVNDPVETPPSIG